MTAPLHTTPPEPVAALHAIRDRHRGDGQVTQVARLLEALQTLTHITTFEASRYRRAKTALQSLEVLAQLSGHGTGAQS